MAKICDDCVYRRPLSSGEQTLCCHYAIDTGKLRNCPVEDCKNKLTLEEAMKRLTHEEKQEIIRLRVEDNVPAKTVAEKFGITKGAVFNIVSAWKKHGESAISDEEIMNELHERDISEAADDDHVCYEVTGDTDIEAYMADRNEKKPDTAATVSDSEQEDLVDIPADIVSQETENVKPDDILPCAAVDAIADQIDRLYDRLAECDREMQNIRDARNSVEGSLIELKAFLKKHGLGDIIKTLDLNAERRAFQGEK